MSIKSLFHSSIVVFYLLTSYLTNGSCFAFDQNYIGVAFRPYVKQAENGKYGYKFYTQENIKSMLTIVSGKFTKVFVEDTYSFEDNYIDNVTYRNGSYVSVYSGEVAAKINRADGKKVLSLLYEAGVADSANRTNAEIQLAFEAAEKANTIFPGTVEGILLGKNSDVLRLKSALDNLKSYKTRASKLQLKLGADLLNCFSFVQNDDEDLVKLEKDVIKNADIVSCRLFVPEKPEEGPLSGLESVTKNLLKFRKIIKEINPNVTVIGNMEWSSSGLEKWKTLENQQIYWESVSKWAAQEKYTVYMEEAFDNPWRDDPASDAHLGWWKLRNNSEINFLDGYVEKVSGRTGKQNKNKGTSALSQNGVLLSGISGLIVVVFFNLLA